MNQRIEGNENIQAGRDANVQVTINQKPEVRGPYTISCPNCGNPVSSAAHACTQCSHPVAEHIKKERIQKVYERVLRFLKGLVIALGFLIGLGYIVPEGYADGFLKFTIYLVFGSILFCLYALGEIKRLLRT